MVSTRNEFFYDIQLEHRSAHNLKCNQNVEVSCTLQLPYCIQSQRTESCQTTGEKSMYCMQILISKYFHCFIDEISFFLLCAYIIYEILLSRRDQIAKSLATIACIC